ncbi:hypothetical protein ACYSNR_17340 [Enterococcus sp. LJL128]
MGIDMFVGSSQSQASSTLAKSQSDQQAYQTMIQALQQFVGEIRLNSTAYNNGKAFYNTVLIPLVKAGILLSEAVGEACQKFVKDYQSTVDSGDLKSDELEERIRQLESQINNLDVIRSTIESKDIADNFKIRQLNQNSRARELLVDSKKVLQDKLEKLKTFHANSPEIFSSISELESIVNQGASQAGAAWTGSSFSIPKDLRWTTTVSEKWQIRADNIKQKEKEFHEKKIKELEKYTIYAWPYEDPVTKEIKVNWFIDKDGVRVFDDELQNYVEKYGKKLEGMYEVVGWEKIYELDLAARRKGNGKNYLTKHQVPKGWEWYSQAGAHVESAYWMANKTGLLDLALLAGLTYAASKSQTKVTTSTNVANVMDDLDDLAIKKANRGNVPKLSTLTEAEQLKLANQYKKKSPINIPENANIKAQSKNGYEQISYKWKENGETIEVRWHTRTPGAPEGQGNTFVVEKKIHGTPDGKQKVQQIMVGKDKWVSKNEWQKAITDRKNGVSTPEQDKMLTDGHWKE